MKQIFKHEVAKYLPLNQKVPNFGPTDLNFIKYVVLTELVDQFGDGGIRKIKLEQLQKGEDKELRMSLAKSLHKAFSVANFLSTVAGATKTWQELDSNMIALLEAEVRAAARFLLEDSSSIRLRP